MTANDFIKSISFELGDHAKKFWDETELFIKLQKAYRELQKELPCFISNEEIDIKEGIDFYHLKFIAIKDISFYINLVKYEFEDIKFMNDRYKENLYALFNKELHINKALLKNEKAKVKYFYLKELENENDFITTPIEYEEALRLLTLSYLFEKAPKDSTKRDLSIHYLKRYSERLEVLKKNKRTKKRIQSNYQRI